MRSSCSPGVRHRSWVLGFRLIFGVRHGVVATRLMTWGQQQYGRMAVVNYKAEYS